MWAGPVWVCSRVRSYFDSVNYIAPRGGKVIQAFFLFVPSLLLEISLKCLKASAMLDVGADRGDHTSVDVLKGLVNQINLNIFSWAVLY